MKITSHNDETGPLWCSWMMTSFRGFSFPNGNKGLQNVYFRALHIHNFKESKTTVLSAIIIIETLVQQ